MFAAFFAQSVAWRKWGRVFTMVAAVWGAQTMEEYQEIREAVKLMIPRACQAHDVPVEEIDERSLRRYVVGSTGKS